MWRTKAQRHRRKEASGDNGRFQEKHRTEFIDSTEFNVMKYLGMTDIFLNFYAARGRRGGHSTNNREIKINIQENICMYIQHVGKTAEKWLLL